MSTRRNDLEKERNSIVKFIEEIEKEKRQTFLDAFDIVDKEIRIYANSGAYPLLHTLDLTPIAAGIEITHIEYNSVDDKVYLMRSDTGNEAILMMPATETPAYGTITTIGSIAANCKAFAIQGLGQDGTIPANIAAIGDCVLHLDAGVGVLNASDLACSDGEAVKTWQDQSGNANHAVQATGAVQPLWDEVDADLGGESSIQFTADWMLLPDSTLFADIVANPQWTIITVFHKLDTSSNMVLWCGDRDVGKGFGVYPSTSSRARISASNYAIGGLSYGGGTKEAVCINMDWDTQEISGFPMSKWIGVRDLATVIGESLTTPQMIGARPNTTLPTVSEVFEGAIAEIIVFEKSLTSTQFETIRRYLIDKYGFTSS